MSNNEPEHKVENTSLVAYIIQSLAAAWELIKLNPRAMAQFDTSADSYWKSFWAIIVVAPVFLISLNVNVDLGLTEAEMQQIPKVSLLAQVISYVFQLPLVAMVMIFFTRFLKIDANYVPMIIAYNWLWVLINYIILPLTLLLSMGIIPLKVGGVLIAALAFYLELYVAWFMFKQALKISGWLAVGVTLFESLLSLTFVQIVIRVF